MAEEEKKQESAPKKGGKGFLIIIIVLLLLVVGGAGAVYFLVLKKPAETESAQTADAAAGAAQQNAGPRVPTAEPGPIQSYPPFLVNLADQGGNRYLKITLSLELSKDKNFPTEVAAKDPKIKDIIISILSAKTYDEISTTQGKMALKQELLRRLNTIMNGGRINDIYITEFVIQ